MTEVQKIRKVKKSKEAEQLLKSMKDTIMLFQEQAEKTIYISIPNQIKELDKIKQLEYFTQEYENTLEIKFQQLEDTTKPFVDESVKHHPLVLQPTAQFLDVEETMNQQVQLLQTMITQIRRSVETLEWKKRSALQEEVQKAIVAQLEVTQNNLQEVSNLFLGYHEGRADIIYNIQKYGCMDYFMLLPILELKLCRSIRNFVSDFRVHLLMLYELLTANYDNILGGSAMAKSEASGNYGVM